MLRISGGTARGRKLKSPAVPEIKLSQELVRQAVFAVFQDYIEGADCLDLFAGSGVIGIEAISRGARHCDFVDVNLESIRAIKDNLKLSGFEEQANVYHKDTLKFIGTSDKTYDLVFLDPFYDQTQHRHLLKTLQYVCHKDTMIAFLHSKDFDISKNLVGTDLKILDERRYGATKVTYLALDK